jgi:hypothetical protein
MEIQFITDAQGKKTAAIVPFDEWERTETAKEILEHYNTPRKLDRVIRCMLGCHSLREEGKDGSEHAKESRCGF